jgi:hypothetical protein
MCYFKNVSTKVPYECITLHAFDSITWTPLCIIIPQHQSLIKLNTSKNTIAYHDVATGTTEIKTTTTHFCKPLILHDLPQTPTKNHRPIALFLQTPLLIFVQQLFTPIALACLKHTWPPIVCCNLFHITDK